MDILYILNCITKCKYHHVQFIFLTRPLDSWFNCRSLLSPSILESHLIALSGHSMYTYIHIDTQNQKRENKDLKKIIKVDQTTAVTCLCFF